MNLRGVRRGRRDKGVDINMAPLIDMIFILLIFFIVTTTFAREAGIDVARPEARTATEQRRPTLQVGLTAGGEIWVEGRMVDLRSVRPLVADFLAATPDGAVLLVADRDGTTGALIALVDQCR
ncbi:MAG: ExbD/TolR family protein, partial [Desulfovibrionaceae bacterium]